MTPEQEIEKLKILLADFQRNAQASEKALADYKRKAAEMQADVDRLKSEVLALQTAEAEAIDTADAAYEMAEESKDRLDNIRHDESMDIVASSRVLKIKQFHYLRLFDLYNVGTTTLRVRGYGTYEFEWNGVFKNVGSGTTGPGGSGPSLDADITIGAATYIYIKFVKSTATATLEQGVTMPDPDADTRYWALWYIGWSSGAPAQINRRQIVDLTLVPQGNWWLPDGLYTYEALTWDDTEPGAWSRGWVKAHA